MNDEAIHAVAKSGDTRPPYNLRAKPVEYKTQGVYVNNGVKLASTSGQNICKCILNKHLWLFVGRIVLFFGLFRLQCAHFLACRIHNLLGDIYGAPGTHGNRNPVAGT
jgi:hypothetical protein